jgi:hypothetical protein
MDTKVIEVAGKRIIVGIDENGNIIAEHYKGDPQPDPPVRTKVPPAGIRDLIRLSDWIISQGHQRGTPEYDKMFTEHRGDLPLEANNLKDLR